MSYQIDYAYTCHMGKVRANNEDNFWCCGTQLPAENQGIEGVHSGKISQCRLPALAVFDGMGGESCGEIAAYLAAEEFGKYYGKNKKYIRKSAAKFIQEACLNMNEAVERYSLDNRVGCMGTTMALTIFAPEAVYACNLGDSRIYQSYDGQFRQISKDHVLGDRMFGKAPLTQYLGMTEEDLALEPWVAAAEYLPKSRYLMCSDGMTDMLSDGEIADILTREIPVDETVDILLERTLLKGGKDNVTIVLCEITEQENRNPVMTWLDNFKKDKHEGDV